MSAVTSSVPVSPPTEAAVAATNPRARKIVLALLAVLLAGWVLIFMSSKGVRQGPRDTGLGGDFATFYTASSMLAHGTDPYNQGSLYAAEVSIFRSQHLPRPGYESYVRAGNPPLLYWALGPFVRLDYRPAAWVWVSIMFVASIVGFIALLAALGWTRRIVPLLLFLAMPQTLLAEYYGNVDALVFAAICASLYFSRKYPVLGGACLALAWLKPQYALPIAALVVVFVIRDPLRSVMGFAIMTVVGVLVTVVTAGPARLAGWVGSLGGLSGNTGKQPDVASLSGLYVYSASASVQRVLMVLSIVLAVAITGAWWWRTRAEPRGDLVRSGWLWVLWLLATPLAHFHYQIILAPVVLALLGRNGYRLGWNHATAVVFILVFSTLLAPTHRGHGDIQSLALVPILVLLFYAAVRQNSGEQASFAY